MPPYHMMSTEMQRQLVERYFYNGWNKCNADVMEEILDENLIFVRGACWRRKRKGFDYFIKHMNLVHDTLDKNIVEAKDIVIQENKAAVRFKSSGIYKSEFFGLSGTGHEVSWQGAIFFTFNKENSRIKEIWVLGGIDSLKHQFGVSSVSTAVKR